MRWQSALEAPWARALVGAGALLLLGALSMRSVTGSEPDRFRPTDITPTGDGDAPGDGHWSAIPDPIRPDAEPLLFATSLHPDRKRPSAVVHVVAVELSEVRLRAVAGTEEPKASPTVGGRSVRSGLVPREPQLRLLAAFDGGPVGEAGTAGMHVDHVTLAPPTLDACTLLALEDGTLRLGSWRALSAQAARAEREARLSFWRQSRPCRYEAGKARRMPVDAAMPEDDPPLERSALGLDVGSKRLYFGIGRDTTARALAEALHRAGASDVFELDSGVGRPKFLVFPHGPDGARRALGVFDGFAFEPDDYVQKPSRRDFFYLERRTAARHR